MKTQDFIDLFIEELEIEETEVTLETEFDSLEEWDSMNRMVVIGLVADNFKVKLTSQDLKSLTTLKSLLDKIGADKFSD